MISTALYYIQNELETLTSIDCYLQLMEGDDLPNNFIMIIQNNGDVIDAIGDRVEYNFSIDIYTENLLTIDNVFKKIGMEWNCSGGEYTKGTDTIDIITLVNTTPFQNMGLWRINEKLYVCYRIGMYINYRQC